MKIILVICGILAVAVTSPTDINENRFNDPVVYRATAECFLDKGPCDEGLELFKSQLPELVRTACATCTNRQKLYLRQFVDSSFNNDIELLNDLVNKYDPDNIYKGPFFESIYRRPSGRWSVSFQSG
uniref:Chemosensory protein n=1 Tax=Histia rhodope TaxID=1453155 RepID=A0A6M9BJQ8_9NEOP|nr:chemosensory protein [Histia rhodope]